LAALGPALSPAVSRGRPSPDHGHLRLQLPPPEPCVTFSVTRLSPRQSTGRIPPRHRRWRPAQATGEAPRPWVLAVAVATWLEALRYDGFCCPADRRYRYGLLRLPLGAPPLPGASGYRLRRSRAPQAGTLGPQTPGPRRISPVQRWAVWSFRSHYAGGFLGAASPSSSHRPWPSPSRSGLGSRSFLLSQACLRRVRRIPHRTDRPLARRPRRLCHGASTLGSPLPPATSYGAAWPLPRPDFHRQVHRRLQDTHRPWGAGTRSGDPTESMSPR
jgi:hypothetical protein